MEFMSPGTARYDPLRVRGACSPYGTVRPCTKRSATCRIFPSFRMRIRATTRPCPCSSWLRPSPDRLASRLSYSDCIFCTITTTSRQLDVKETPSQLLPSFAAYYISLSLDNYFLVCSVNSLYFLFSTSIFLFFLLPVYRLGYKR